MFLNPHDNLIHFQQFDTPFSLNSINIAALHRVLDGD
tara:strand:- start:471 stop:581 length:111 start_codon:yes stop_codon:yes gene_type:complete